MSNEYTFDSRHNTILIDRKNFVKTMDQDLSDGPKQVIEIVARTGKTIVSFRKINDKTIFDSSFEKLEFVFYKNEYGRIIYKEVVK